MNAAAPTRDGTASAAIPGGTSPLEVWRRFGLSARSPVPTEPHLVPLPRSQRFRLALESLGGWYRKFGRFLAGRIDLLPGGHAIDLERITLPLDTNDPVDFARQRFGDRLRDLEPLRAFPMSAVYAADYLGIRVVLEVFSSGVPAEDDPAWKEFRSGLAPLSRGEESRAVSAHTLREYRQWLLLHADIERKREILKNLALGPADGIFRLPEMVEGLASERTLACVREVGTPLPDMLQPGGGPAASLLTRLFEGMLQHTLFYSMVCADIDLGNVLVCDEGLAFEAFPAVQPVPPEANFELIQYSASLASGDTARAIRMLARLCGGDSERSLWREFSGLQPLLKIRLTTPASLTTMENLWRASAATKASPPLFLQLFHRNTFIGGEHNGRLDPQSDLFSEALWPVLGRILRFRLGEVASVEKAREWMLGTGLLFFAGARQAGLTLDQLRDNDFSLIVDARQEVRDAGKPRRTVVSIAGAAVLAAILVASLEVALRANLPTLTAWASVVAAASGIGLFYFVARIQG